MSTSPSPAAAAHGVPDGDLRVDFFDAPITPALWRVYEKSTRSYACTREFIEYFEDAAGASLALVRSPGGRVRAAFLYQLCPGGAAHVLGRFFAPAPEELRAFVEAVLARHRGVNRIDTDLIDALADPRAIGRPVLALREGVELRIALPGSMEEYERTLDRRFVRQSRYYARRLARECPSSRIMTLEGEKIPRSWVADVVRLNRERMASKNVESVFDDHYEEGIFSVVRAHGCVTVALDGERVCAGAIDICCSDEVYGWVIGHDNAYGRFGLGMMCQLASVRYEIASGVRTIHQLHGESDYKRALGGKPAPLASYIILRAWTALEPGDIARVLLKHSEWIARKAIDAGDTVVAERVLKRKAPIRSFARSVARLMSRLARHGRWGRTGPGARSARGVPS